MKERFLAIMKELFPKGIPTRGEEDAVAARELHKVIVLTYCPGRAEGLGQIDDRMMLSAALVGIKEMMKPGWLPDDSWKWW